MTEKVPCFARDRFILFLVKKKEREPSSGKGVHTQIGLGSLNFLYMAPTWLRPGIKISARQKRGIFSFRDHSPKSSNSKKCN